MRTGLGHRSTLATHLPAGQRDNEVGLEAAACESIDAVLTRYRVPPRRAHRVLANGNLVPPRLRTNFRLAEGDRLAARPPVAGG